MTSSLFKNLIVKLYKTEGRESVGQQFKTVEKDEEV